MSTTGGPGSPTPPRKQPDARAAAASSHLPEYMIEAAGLGLFMIAAGAFGVLLEHPASPVRGAIADSFARRALMGLAMGLTAAALIYSPWGRRSGAHFNPAVTLTFLRLGKVAPRDAIGYAVAQFLGGAAGLALAAIALRGALSHASVHFVATVPGSSGVAAAFSAEVALTFLLMTVVLTVSNTPRIAAFTGVCAACCVALFITFEAPISGMSMNPARTFASALLAWDWRAAWIYFVAPPLGMALAAAWHTRRGRVRHACAKMHHDPAHRCIFCAWQRESGSRWE